MISHLEFEKPIIEMESKIQALKGSTETGDLDIAQEVERIQKKLARLLKDTYSKLTANQKVQVARHANRPHSTDYIRILIDDFTPLAGDRLYGEDAALIGGIGRFKGQSCIILGHEKGHDTETRIKHNFGMTAPEGYRKAQRLMALANQYKIPVLSFVDTAGAYPGLGAEERGQSEAIARSIESSLRLNVPFIATIIGEGGSGGAIAIASADKVLMLEHSIYSVISPEGCASILWRSASFSKEAAEALKLTAEDLYKLGVIDEIILEPLGGAHRLPDQAINNVGAVLEKSLQSFQGLSADKLISNRRKKFLDMGQKGL